MIRWLVISTSAAVLCGHSQRLSTMRTVFHRRRRDIYRCLWNCTVLLSGHISANICFLQCCIVFNKFETTFPAKDIFILHDTSASYTILHSIISPNILVLTGTAASDFPSYTRTRLCKDKYKFKYKLFSLYFNILQPHVCIDLNF